jgi:cobalamin biosynthesis protein CobT
VTITTWICLRRHPFNPFTFNWSLDILTSHTSIIALGSLHSTSQAETPIHPDVDAAMPRKSRDVKSTAPSPSPARATRASRSRTAEDRDEVASVTTQPTVPEEDEDEAEDEEEGGEEAEEESGAAEEEAAEGEEEAAEGEEEAAEGEEEAAEGEEEAPAKVSREERMAKLKELRMRMVSCLFDDELTAE